MLNTRIVILALVLAHLLAGRLSAWYVTDWDLNWATAAFFVVLFSQSSLLGSWAALGTTQVVWRVSGMLVGTLYPWALPVVAVDAEHGPGFARSGLLLLSPSYRARF